jgi:hypothetical protein
VIDTAGGLECLRPAPLSTGRTAGDVVQMMYWLSGGVNSVVGYAAMTVTPERVI